VCTVSLERRPRWRPLSQVNPVYAFLYPGQEARACGPDTSRPPLDVTGAGADCRCAKVLDAPGALGLVGKDRLGEIPPGLLFSPTPRKPRLHPGSSPGQRLPDVRRGGRFNTPLKSGPCCVCFHPVAVAHDCAACALCHKTIVVRLERFSSGLDLLVSIQPPSRSENRDQ